jgi:hypothetical protein
METPSKLSKLPVEEPLKLSTIVGSCQRNYVTAELNRIQLEDLQSWLRQQATIFNNK